MHDLELELHSKLVAQASSSIIFLARARLEEDPDLLELARLGSST